MEIPGPKIFSRSGGTWLPVTDGGLTERQGGIGFVLAHGGEIVFAQGYRMVVHVGHGRSPIVVGRHSCGNGARTSSPIRTTTHGLEVCVCA